MKWIIRTIIYFLLVFSSTSRSYSQGTSDIDQVLNTAFKDSAVDFKNAKWYQLGALDYTVPFIEKIELRSETNDFDLMKQDFSVRISPNNKSSREAHRRYHESVMFMAEMEFNTEIMKVLFEKYQLCKDYAYSFEMLELEKIKKAVALDKIKLLKKMISLSSFDIVELIEAEDEVYELERKVQSFQNDLVNYHRQLQELLSKEEVNIDLVDMISVEQIKSLISLQMLKASKSHSEEEVLSAKHYNVMMEYEWISAKNKFSLGFIQAQYGNDPEKTFGDNFSLGLGLDFPIKGSKGLELNEIKVDILDAQSEYLELSEQIKNNQQILESRLMSLIDMYELLTVQIKEGNADHALIEYSRQGVASPKAILKLKELTVKNEALLIEIRFEIIDSYLEYIYNTGVIGNKPYKNYLNENLSNL